HFNHETDNKNTVDVTAYYSNDRFKLNSDTLYQYNNFNTTVRWKHAFSNKLYGVLTGTLNEYRFQVSSDKNAVNAVKLDYRIGQLSAKADFSYQADDRHLLSFGITGMHYKLRPGALTPLGSESRIVPDRLED